MPPSQREVKDKAESFVGFFLFKRKKEILVLHEMFLEIPSACPTRLWMLK